MKYFMVSCISILIYTLPNSAGAVKIYECVDDAGNSTFQDRCPPGTSPKSEKKYGTTAPNQESDSYKSIGPVILYYIPECQGCNQVRAFFYSRNINLAEKNIEDNIELQDELKEKIGSLSVPTVDINGQYVSGYNENALKKLITTGNSS